MEIFRITRNFPKEEKYSLIDQIVRSSRAVCACIAEAYRKRRYEAHFIAKLTDADSAIFTEEARYQLVLSSALPFRTSFP